MVIGEPATVQPLLKIALLGFGSVCSLLHLCESGHKSMEGAVLPLS